MSHRLTIAVLLFAVLTSAAPAPAQDRLLEELTCEPVNGYI